MRDRLSDMTPIRCHNFLEIDLFDVSKRRLFIGDVVVAGGASHGPVAELNSALIIKLERYIRVSDEFQIINVRKGPHSFGVPLDLGVCAVCTVHACLSRFSENGIWQRH